LSGGLHLKVSSRPANCCGCLIRSPESASLILGRVSEGQRGGIAAKIGCSRNRR